MRANINQFSEVGLFVLALACVSTAAQATEQTRPPPSGASLAKSEDQLLEEYLRMAVERSDTLAARTAKGRAALAAVEPSGALPNPMVGVMYQSVGMPWSPMGPMSMVQGEVSQSFYGSGKREARRRVAGAEAALITAEQSLERNEIRVEVTRAFAEIYAVDEELRVTETADAVLEVLRGTLLARMSSGRADTEAIAKLELERSRLSEQRLDLRANRAIWVTRLNRVLSRDSAAPVPELRRLPEAPPVPSATPAAALARSPELQTQRAAVLIANRRRESAEAEARADYSVGLAGGTTTSGDPVVVLRFGMELPLWQSTKQEPLIRAAHHDSEAAQHEYRAIALRVRAQLNELLARFERDTQQVELHRSTIVPAAEQVLNAARATYASGQGDLTVVLEDYRNWLDAQVGLGRRQAERLVTRAELLALLNPIRQGER